MTKENGSSGPEENAGMTGFEVPPHVHTPDEVAFFPDEKDRLTEPVLTAQFIGERDRWTTNVAQMRRELDKTQRAVKYLSLAVIVLAFGSFLYAVKGDK